jgi:Tfp pilus assembly protein PilF
MANPANQIQQLFAEGTQLLQVGNAAEALVRFQNALNLDSSHAILYLHAGAALHSIGRYDEAIANYLKALQVAPDIGEIHNNLGNSLMALGRFSEAASSFTTASKLLTTSPVPLTARATALQAQGKIAEAEIDCRNALLLDPDFAEAHWNLSLNLLLQGHYAEGWCEYEWRWKKPDFTSPRRHIYMPSWEGGELNGKTVLLHAEQGFGDAIQFVRYVPLVVQRGGTVVVECHPQLVSLFRGIKEISTVVAFDDQIPECDYQAPFLSLPRLLGTTLNTIPVCPAINIAAERLEKWKYLVRQSSLLKVGFVWSGSSIHRNDSFRSFSLELLSAWANYSEIQLFSLQMGEAKQVLKHSLLAECVCDLTDHICDFADTAALIKQLDLVISVDTSVAHLAGTLGVPVLLLIPYAPDWRWMLDRCASPWYPTLHIFRQNQMRDWGEVISRVNIALEILLKYNCKNIC